MVLLGQRRLGEAVNARRACAAILTLACLAWSAPARPCALIPGRGSRVQTKWEDAFIVWDEARHVEHFIRRAVFDTTAKSFGFVVPTPTRPTLAEASDDVYGALEGLAKKERGTKWIPRPVWYASLLVYGGDDSVSAGYEPRVTILEETKVAGLDATVLAADDTAALSDWLGAHGFEMRDALRRWLDVYVAKKWTFTAFRYERPLPASNAAPVVDSMTARAIRITFSSDFPFYPYLEPDDAPFVEDRELDLFLVSDRPMRGVLIEPILQPWPVEIRLAADVSLPPSVSAAVPGLALPAHAWVNYFIDRAEKRQGADLVFMPARSSEPVRPRPKVRILYLPYELPLGVLAGIGWWWRRRAKRRSPVG